MKYKFNIEFVEYWCSTNEEIYLESSSETVAWDVVSQWAEYEMNNTGWGSGAIIPCNGKVRRVGGFGHLYM